MLVTSLTLAASAGFTSELDVAGGWNAAVLDHQFGVLPRARQLVDALAILARFHVTDVLDVRVHFTRADELEENHGNDTFPKLLALVVKRGKPTSISKS